MAQRLLNQQIIRPRWQNPGDLVGWFGAVQAQDFSSALWALGLRLPKATHETIEAAITTGEIVRTWPLRGTLHFVAKADVHWMLGLTGARTIARAASRFRSLELDEGTLSRCRLLVERALEGGRRIERGALFRMLEAAGVSTKGQRGIHILWRLAHDRVICFGPRRGKQSTFTLLDEWCPRRAPLDRDEALGTLASRYLQSHGPAEPADLAWWAGITLSEAREAFELINANQRVIPSRRQAALPTAQVALLPAFDEYLVGYQDRSLVLDPQHRHRFNRGGGMLAPTIVANGRVVGTWTRTLTSKQVTITPQWFGRPVSTARLTTAADAVGSFLGINACLSQLADRPRPRKARRAAAK